MFSGHECLESCFVGGHLLVTILFRAIQLPDDMVLHSRLIVHLRGRWITVRLETFPRSPPFLEAEEEYCTDDSSNEQQDPNDNPCNCASTQPTTRA